MLDERDARRITAAVVERLRALGGRPTQIGAAIDHDGFWITAVLEGRPVSVRAGEGTIRYDTVARELLIKAVSPTADTLTRC